MSVWDRILSFLSNFEAINPFADIFHTDPEKTVAFTVSIIALSAKMAKADGQVTRDEVIVLRQIFDFSAKDEASIARVFDLARKDVTGFEAYAKRIKRLFRKEPEMLEDIFESLFQIAMADNEFHESEAVFLGEVSKIFELDDNIYLSLQNRYNVIDKNPYHILGLPRDASIKEAEIAFKKLVRENHPDRLRARGLPDEAIQIAETRMRVINEAYDAINSA